LSIANPLQNIVREFSKMPGIGQKTAQRLAFYLLGLPKEEIDDLVFSIKEIKNEIGFCETCFHITYKSSKCYICNNVKRATSTQLCIVSDSKDLLAMEKMGRFSGKYHVLGGVISPLSGIGPEQLRIKELLERIGKEEITEVVFAISPSIEGETTTLYLRKLLQPLIGKISQIAYGIPLGTDLEWADELTLCRAYEGRNLL